MNSSKRKRLDRVMRKQCEAFDAKQKAMFTITDVTPNGFGPGTESPENTYDPHKQIHLSTEEMVRNMDVSEGQTILKGNNISDSKRKAIQKHIDQIT